MTYPEVQSVSKPAATSVLCPLADKIATLIFELSQANPASHAMRGLTFANTEIYLDSKLVFKNLWQGRVPCCSSPVYASAVLDLRCPYNIALEIHLPTYINASI